MLNHVVKSHVPKEMRVISDSTYSENGVELVSFNHIEVTKMVHQN
jgi:hypothetical protein